MFRCQHYADAKRISIYRGFLSQRLLTSPPTGTEEAGSREDCVNAEKEEGMDNHTARERQEVHQLPSRRRSTSDQRSKEADQRKNDTLAAYEDSPEHSATRPAPGSLPGAVTKDVIHGRTR